jgi:N-acetylneuraminate synthase
MIEKHVTLNRKLPGPDHPFALEPRELKAMVKAVRAAEEKMKQGRKVRITERMLGSPMRKTYPVEEYIRRFTYRGIFSTRLIKRGEKLSARNIAVLRPGEKRNGIHPRYYNLLTKGYRAARDVKRASGIRWNDVLTR